MLKLQVILKNDRMNTHISFIGFINCYNCLLWERVKWGGLRSENVRAGKTIRNHLLPCLHFTDAQAETRRSSETVSSTPSLDQWGNWGPERERKWLVPGHFYPWALPQGARRLSPQTPLQSHPFSNFQHQTGEEDDGGLSNKEIRTHEVRKPTVVILGVEWQETCDCEHGHAVCVVRLQERNSVCVCWDTCWFRLGTKECD